MYVAVSAVTDKHTHKLTTVTPAAHACRGLNILFRWSEFKITHIILYRNKVLWTPLDCAAANGHARVIKELATAKAELDPKDKLKTTPLHLAAKEGHVTAVETLIKHGANVGLKDQRGFNALDWAIEKGHKYEHIYLFVSL